MNFGVDVSSNGFPLPGRRGVVSVRITQKPTQMFMASGVLHFVADSLESCGLIHCEVSEHLAVDLDAGLVNKTHELAVGKFFLTRCGIDTLDPESAEVALFLLAVAISVSQTFLPSILGDGPHVATASIVTAGKLKDFLSLGT